MSGRPHTLLYWPRVGRWEHVPGARLPLGDASVFAVQRTLGPELAFSTSYAHVGAELLGVADRPVFGGGAVLLWAPILPSRCLFTARDASGTYRIAPAPADDGDAIAQVLEELEVECALAFEEALAPTPYPPEVTRHLGAALEWATTAARSFGDPSTTEQVAS